MKKEKLYCLSCEKMITGINLERFGHVTRPFNDEIVYCFGPYTSCPPPEEGGFLLASDADFEQEEPEPTYEDVHIMQTVDEFLTHYIPD